MSRLLSINSYHYRRGGADAVYFDHAAMMESLGWKNAFFSMHHPDNLPSDWSKYFVDEIQLGHSYTLPQKISKATKVIYSFEARRKLRKLLADFRPTLAHFHNIYHHLSPSILSVLKEFDIPVVMTVHDLKIACPNNKMLTHNRVCERCKVGRYYQAVRHRCIHGSLLASTIIAMESYLHNWLQSYNRFVDRMLVPSHFFIRKFAEWDWPESMFTYVPNFIDASHYEPNPEPGHYFVYFGRLSVEKGIETLIRAAKIADVPVKLVGTGPLDAELKTLARELDAPVDFLGYQTGADLHRLVSQSTAAILPSEWYENAPISVLESHAFAKPVIGADIGGIPEMIRHGRTGWLFKSGDIDSLADMLTKVSRTPADALVEIGKNARAAVEDAFSPARYINSIVDIYSSLGVQMTEKT